MEPMGGRKMTGRAKTIKARSVLLQDQSPVPDGAAAIGFVLRSDPEQSRLKSLLHLMLRNSRLASIFRFSHVVSLTPLWRADAHASRCHGAGRNSPRI